jgi:hypothetical protein
MPTTNDARSAATSSAGRRRTRARPAARRPPGTRAAEARPSPRRRLGLAAASALAVASLPGCRTIGSEVRSACPEYRDLACLSQVDCVWDAARGCSVCRCLPVDQGAQQGSQALPSAPRGAEPVRDPSRP